MHRTRLRRLCFDVHFALEDFARQLHAHFKRILIIPLFYLWYPRDRSVGTTSRPPGDKNGPPFSLQDLFDHSKPVGGKSANRTSEWRRRGPGGAGGHFNRNSGSTTRRREVPEKAKRSAAAVPPSPMAGAQGPGALERLLDTVMETGWKRMKTPLGAALVHPRAWGFTCGGFTLSRPSSPHFPRRVLRAGQPPKSAVEHSPGYMPNGMIIGHHDFCLNPT